MICVALNGDTYVSINQGSYKFTAEGLWKANEGLPQERIRLADIDGDGGQIIVPLPITETSAVGEMVVRVSVLSRDSWAPGHISYGSPYFR